ncbi:MAG: hypothetical protein ABL879_12600 [Devosia sp.]
MTDQATPSTAPDKLPEMLETTVAEALAEPIPVPPDFTFANERTEPEIVTPETASRRRRASRQLFAAAVASFSITLAAVSYGVLGGYVPLRMSAIDRVDFGALLLVVPLVALMLALVFEATRLALRGPVSIAEPKTLPIAWAPGHREG